MQTRMRENPVLRITICGMFMAMIIALSSFSIPVPGGHLYLCDVAITTASILLDPISSMIVAGVGTFLGDAIFYPAPMFVSLVVHGLQGFVISWCAHNVMKKKPVWGAILGVTLGVIILVVGYTFGRIYIYGVAPEGTTIYAYALMKLPFEILQGVIGAVSGVLLTYGLGLKHLYNKMIRRH